VVSLRVSFRLRLYFLSLRDKYLVGGLCNIMQAAKANIEHTKCNVVDRCIHKGPPTNASANEALAGSPWGSVNDLVTIAGTHWNS
jgi:hypothetical protein